MASAFPKLPGYVPTHDCTKVDWKKISHMQLAKLQNPKTGPAPLHALPRKPEPVLPPEKGPESLSYSQSVFKNPAGSDIREKFEPTFVKLDKQVLRFFGYFKESVIESARETFKIRKVILMFYLDDCTLALTEPRQQNSGTPQGIFLKRQMVLRADGSGLKLAPEDFKVGQDVTIYGRTIHIYDCDQYTREFYANLKTPQPEAEAKSAPADNFELQPQKAVLTHDRDFNEYYLGGLRIQSQKQFLDNDRKVLRFFAMCESMPYIIHYFLADDTVEVREVHFSNEYPLGSSLSGCHPYPLLLRRQKMLKAPKGMYQPGQTPLLQEYTKEEDFFVPSVPNCSLTDLGKPIRGPLPSCVWTATRNSTTRRSTVASSLWGRLSRPSLLSPKVRGHCLRVAPVVPPYNGFGDEADSMGYVYRLDPKPPKKDFFKYVDNDKVVLRYTAKLNTTIPEDIDRRFIISYFLADNSLSIYEPPKRNSGIAEGKFLERRKYRNTTGLREFIEPTDLAVGGNVVINSYSFQLLSADEFTVAWNKQHLA